MFCACLRLASNLFWMVGRSLQPLSVFIGGDASAISIASVSFRFTWSVVLFMIFAVKGMSEVGVPLCLLRKCALHGFWAFVVSAVLGQCWSILTRSALESSWCPSRGPCIACQTGIQGCCTTKNVVYKLECTLCQESYVGEAKRPVRERIMEHQRAALTKTY